MSYQFGYSPYCKDCNHSESWHHANMKYQGKTITCYGIGCLCTTSTQNGSTKA